MQQSLPKQQSDGSVSLRDRKAAQMRVHIYGISWRLVNQRGFESVSIDAICDEAVITKKTFFNYFEKKEDVLIYAAKVWNLRYGHSQTQTGVNGIRNLCAQMCAFQEEHPEFFAGPITSIAKALRGHHNPSLESHFRLVEPSSLEQCILLKKPLIYDLPSPPTLLDLLSDHLSEAADAGEVIPLTPDEVSDTALALIAALYGGALIAGMRKDKPLNVWVEAHVGRVLKNIEPQH